jgi:SAM-dependent methyltransferase
MKNPVPDRYPDNPAQSEGFRVIEDAAYGFRRLDPIPPEAELSEFYESRYYDLLRKGNRSPDIRRLMEGGDPAAKELRWLREGVYTDIVKVLNDAAPGRSLLEVGCGIGNFLSFAQEHGFSVVGTEPSHEAAQHAASKGSSRHWCGLATEGSNQSSGSKNSLELRPSLLPFALEETQANHVVHSIAPHDVLPQAALLHETERLVHSQHAAIEIQDRTADLIEPQLRENVLQNKIFREHAHVLPAHVDPNYIEPEFTPLIASIDVIDVEQPHVLLVAADNPVTI